MTTLAGEPILRDATSKMLEAHRLEILEECTTIVEYCQKLRQTNLSQGERDTYLSQGERDTYLSQGERDTYLSQGERDTYEGELYAALTHLQNHVGPALQEWDRVDGDLPEEDD